MIKSALGDLRSRVWILPSAMVVAGGLLGIVGIHHLLLPKPQLLIFSICFAPVLWAFLTTSKKWIEWSLIVSGIFSGFFYRALRPTVYDSFLWILIIPGMILFYLLLSHSKDQTLVIRTKLDKLVAAYFIYGVFSTTIGLVLTGNPVSVLKVFAHAYFPCIFYFVTRSYSQNSLESLSKIFNMCWILCLVILGDFYLEYYFIEIVKNREVIPWAAASLREIMATLPPVERLDPGLPFKCMGILGSSKVLSMVISTLTCLLAGFLLAGKSEMKGKKFSLYQWSTVINVLLFILLIGASFMLRSEASTASILVVICLLVFFNKKGRLKAAFLALVFFVVGTIVLYDHLMIVYQYYFLASGSSGKAIIEYIFDFSLVIQEYVANPVTVFVGNSVLGGSMIRGGSASELRLLVYPVYYGVAWGILMGAIAWNLFKYCRQIATLNKSAKWLNPVGLGLLGFFLVYFFDVHYPSFDRHGPMELFFVMAGVTASLHELVMRNQIKAEV